MLLNDVFVVQLTGRMHYGAARALEGSGRLAALLTDFRLPPRLRYLARKYPTLNRYVLDLPEKKVIGDPKIGVIYRGLLRALPQHQHLAHVFGSQELAKQSVRAASAVEFDTLFSFDIQALETFEAFSGSRRLVLEQCVAPRAAQLRLQDRFRAEGILPPNWQRKRETLKRLRDREYREWDLADIIVCPSQYVKDQLLLEGVDGSKVTVVPYGYSAKERNEKEHPMPGVEVSVHTASFNPVRSFEDQKLEVLFVGEIGYRKGFHDVINAAKTLHGIANFTALGPVASEFSVSSNLPPNVTILGKVPFTDVIQRMKSSHVALLPSYLEGSATSIYEGFSYGLPAIVTRETGTVVEHGTDGFIVTAGNPQGIAERITYLHANREALQKMSNQARLASEKNTIAEYSRRLCAAF